MSGPGGPRFTPRARREAARSYDRENLHRELTLLQARIEAVTAQGRQGFHDGGLTYDMACMVVIRLAALMERAELEPWLAVLTREERLAIRTARDIVAHAGYRLMNDDVFWLAITRRIPEMLARIRAGAGFDSSTDGKAPGLDGCR